MSSTMSDAVAESPGGGNDTIYATVELSHLQRQFDRGAVGGEPGGTEAIDLTGNDFANTHLRQCRRQRADRRRRRGHFDRLGGNDVYVVDNAATRWSRAPGGGNDVDLCDVELRARRRRSGRDAVDAPTSRVTTAIDLTGNELRQHDLRQCRRQRSDRRRRRRHVGRLRRATTPIIVDNASAMWWSRRPAGATTRSMRR